MSRGKVAAVSSLIGVGIVGFLRLLEALIPQAGSRLGMDSFFLTLSGAVGVSFLFAASYALVLRRFSRATEKWLSVGAGIAAIVLFIDWWRVYGEPIIGAYQLLSVPLLGLVWWWYAAQRWLPDGGDGAWTGALRQPGTDVSRGRIAGIASAIGIGCLGLSTVAGQLFERSGETEMSLMSAWVIGVLVAVSFFCTALVALLARRLSPRAETVCGVFGAGVLGILLLQLVGWLPVEELTVFLGFALPLSGFIWLPLVRRLAGPR